MLRKLLSTFKKKRDLQNSDMSSFESENDESENERDNQTMITSNKRSNNIESGLLDNELSKKIFKNHFRNTTPLQKQSMTSAENKNNVNDEIIPLNVNNEIRNRITKLNNYRKKKKNQTLKKSFKRINNYTKKNKLTNILQDKLNIDGTKQEKVLELVCPNSNLCLGFNQYYRDILKNYFNYFTTFEYLIDSHVLSKNSSNGMTNILKYKRNNYESDVIMKNIPNTLEFPKSDNLFYETFVGLNYVNEYNNIYPVFLETYGAGFIHDDTILNHIITKYKGERISLQRGMINMIYNNNQQYTKEDLLNYMCNKLNKQTIFIQTIADASSFGDFINILHSIVEDRYIPLIKKKNPDVDQINAVMDEIIHILINIMLILYQIYYTLYDLDGKFVHYDLHHLNVLLYKVPDDESGNKRHFDMTYYKKNRIESNFRTNIIPKIIDYGRCYTPETDDIMNDLEQLPIFKSCISIRIIDTNITNREMKDYFILNGAKVINYSRENSENAFIILESEAQVDQLSIDSNKLLMIQNTNKRFYLKVISENNAIKMGLTWMYDKSLDSDNYYISSRLYNCSHDLRCLFTIYNMIIDVYNLIKKTPDEMKYLLKYTELRKYFMYIFAGKPLYSDNYGTKPLSTRGLSNPINIGEQQSLHNVKDAYLFYKELVTNQEIMDKYNNYFDSLHPENKPYSHFKIYGNGKHMESKT